MSRAALTVDLWAALLVVLTVDLWDVLTVDLRAALLVVLTVDLWDVLTVDLWAALLVDPLAHSTPEDRRRPPLNRWRC